MASGEDEEAGAKETGEVIALHGTTDAVTADFDLRLRLLSDILTKRLLSATTGTGQID